MISIKDWSLPEDQELFGLLPEGHGQAVLEAFRCQKTLETLLQVTDDFIYIKDLNHKFIYASDAFAQLTRHNSWRDLIGKDDFDVFPSEHAEVYYQYEQTVLKEGRKLAMHEEPYYDLQGNLRWVTSTKNPVFDAQGNVIGLVGISKDITDLKTQQQRIEHLATHDHLTGLLNRRALFEMGDLFFEKAERDKQQVAMLFIDLDKFKYVNDTYGHNVGDELLIKFSERLKSSTRASDLVVRMGGDEFVICMSSNKNIRQAAIKCAERISAEQVCEHGTCCGCSIGIAVTHSNYKLLSLLSEADNAMYTAKSNAQLFECIER